LSFFDEEKTKATKEGLLFGRVLTSNLKKEKHAFVWWKFGFIIQNLKKETIRRLMLLCPRCPSWQEAEAGRFLPEAGLVTLPVPLVVIVCITLSCKLLCFQLD